MLKTIGLTGSIASGKSTASKILKEQGCTIIDGDVIAREVVKEPQVLFEIRDTFGKDFLNEEGELRRKKLGEHVFNNSPALEKLNQIMHPRIQRKIKEEITCCRRKFQSSKTRHFVVVDGALLIEMNLHHWVDEVWVVVLSKKEQIRRLTERDSISEQEAERRIAAQMSTEEKLAYADAALDNSKDRQYLKEQINKELERLRNQDSQ